MPALKHPLHPALVHLPIGMFVGTLVFDIIYLSSNSVGSALAAYYCMGLGIVGALLAVVPGYLDYRSLRGEPRGIAQIHLLLNVVVVGLFAANFLMRRGMADALRPTIITNAEFVLTVIGIVILSVSGFLGGTLVYHYRSRVRQEPTGARAELRRIA